MSCADIYPILGIHTHSHLGIQSSLPFTILLRPPFLAPIPRSSFSSLLFLLEPHALFSNSLFFYAFASFVLYSRIFHESWLPWPENSFLLLTQSFSTFWSFIQTSSWSKGSFNSHHAPYYTVSSFVDSKHNPSPHKFHIGGQSMLVERIFEK